MSDGIIHLGLLEDEAIVLDTAALELALLDHSDAEVEPFTDLLAEIAERILRLGASASTSADRAGVLAQVIGEEYGFTGDRISYDSPDNADMVRVLERRRGLPVSLSIIYVAAARRIGWDAVALNTPGHVLTRIGGETDPVLIDPFNNGAIIGSDELGAILSGIFGRSVRPSAEHLVPMSNRAVLVRLLMNQATRAERDGERGRALTLFERMTVVAPDQTQPWWERARLEIAHGLRNAARASLSAMLELTRDPATRMNVSAALDALSGMD